MPQNAPIDIIPRKESNLRDFDRRKAVWKNHIFSTPKKSFEISNVVWNFKRKNKTVWNFKQRLKLQTVFFEKIRKISNVAAANRVVRDLFTGSKNLYWHIFTPHIHVWQKKYFFGKMCLKFQTAFETSNEKSKPFEISNGVWNFKRLFSQEKNTFFHNHFHNSQWRGICSRGQKTPLGAFLRSHSSRNRRSETTSFSLWTCSFFWFFLETLQRDKGAAPNCKAN